MNVIYKKVQHNNYSFISHSKEYIRAVHVWANVIREQFGSDLHYILQLSEKVKNCPLLSPLNSIRNII